MFRKYIQIILLLTSFSLVFISCKNVPHCIANNSKAITIKWGYANYDNGTISKYLLATDLKVYEIKQGEQNNEIKKQINTIDEKKYCSILNQTTKTMLKTQILNEACRDCKYIEWNNPGLNTDIRLNWNSKYVHSGTALASELFDSLMAITIPTK